MDKSESHKKENQSTCNKTRAIIECEAVCKEILKCVHEPATQNKVARPKVKKERELLDGVEEFFIFWS